MNPHRRCPAYAAEMLAARSAGRFLECHDQRAGRSLVFVDVEKGPEISQDTTRTRTVFYVWHSLHHTYRGRPRMAGASTSGFPTRWPSWPEPPDICIRDLWPGVGHENSDAIMRCQNARQVTDIHFAACPLPHFGDVGRLVG